MQPEMSVTFCVTAPGRHPITLRPEGIYRFRCNPAPARSPVDAHLLADVWYSTKKDGTVRDHKQQEFFGVVGNAHAITIQPDRPTAIKLVSTLAADSSALQFIFGHRQLEPADDFRWAIVPSRPSGRGYIVHPGLTVNVLRVKWPLDDDGDLTASEGLAGETAAADDASTVDSVGLYDDRELPSDGSDTETEAPDAKFPPDGVPRGFGPDDDDTGTVVAVEQRPKSGDGGESVVQRVRKLFENVEPAKVISTAVRNATLDKQSEAKLNALFVAAGFPAGFVSELTNASKGSGTDLARKELAKYEVIRTRTDPGLDADSPLNALRAFMSALNKGNLQLLLLKESDDTLAAIDKEELGTHEPGKIVVTPIEVNQVRHELTFEGPVQSEEIDIGDGVSTAIGLTGYGANVGIGSGKVLAEVDGITFKGDVVCNLQWAPADTGDEPAKEDESSNNFSYEVPFGIKEEDGNPFKELYTVTVSKQFPYIIRVTGTLHNDHWRALKPETLFTLPDRIFVRGLRCELTVGTIGETFFAYTQGLHLALSSGRQQKYGKINVRLGHFTEKSSSALKRVQTIAEN